MIPQFKPDYEEPSIFQWCEEELHNAEEIIFTVQKWRLICYNTPPLSQHQQHAFVSMPDVRNNPISSSSWEEEKIEGPEPIFPFSPQFSSRSVAHFPPPSPALSSSTSSSFLFPVPTAPHVSSASLLPPAAEENKKKSSAAPSERNTREEELEHMIGDLVVAMNRMSRNRESKGRSSGRSGGKKKVHWQARK